MADPHVLLQRQTDFLLSRSDADFLVQIEPFLRALRGEPQIEIHIADLRREAGELAEAWNEITIGGLPQLIDLRNRLTQLQPAADDSNLQRPSEIGRGNAFLEWDFSLNRFDALAANPPGNVNRRPASAHLVAILQAKEQKHLAPISDRAGPEEKAALEEWRRDLLNLDAQLAHEHRRLELTVRASPAVALQQMDDVPAQINPPATPLTAENEGEWVNLAFERVGGIGHLLERTVMDDRLDTIEQGLVADHLQQLRDAVAILREELWTRIDTTRSRLGLVLRYKERAEWHDREWLLQVASGEAGGSGGPEDRLTADFARYLFDQGLSPITKPMTAGLQPDLLDPIHKPAFYVEPSNTRSAATLR
jgi:hypothetical protein